MTSSERNDETFYVTFRRTYFRTGYMVVQAQSQEEAAEVVRNVLKEDQRKPMLSENQNLSISSKIQQDQFYCPSSDDVIEALHHSESSVNRLSLPAQYILVKKYIAEDQRNGCGYAPWSERENVEITYDLKNLCWYISDDLYNETVKVLKNEDGVDEVQEIDPNDLKYKMNGINPSQLVEKL